MASTSGTTQLVHVPDWPARAEARLLVPWRKPVARAFVRALAEGAQLHEEQCHSLLVSTRLTVATGVTLDRWGEIVGEQRLGLGDSEYRQFIQARMLVNRSASTTDELIEILEVAAAPHRGVYSERLEPATMVLTVVRDVFLSDLAKRRVARLMESPRPGGRALVVIEALYGGFGWEDVPDFLVTGFDAGGYARRIL